MRSSSTSGISESSEQLESEYGSLTAFTSWCYEEGRTEIQTSTTKFVNSGMETITNKQTKIKRIPQYNISSYKKKKIQHRM